MQDDGGRNILMCSLYMPCDTHQPSNGNDEYDNVLFRIYILGNATNYNDILLCDDWAWINCPHKYHAMHDPHKCKQPWCFYASV